MLTRTFLVSIALAIVLPSTALTQDTRADADADSDADGPERVRKEKRRPFDDFHLPSHCHRIVLGRSVARNWSREVLDKCVEMVSDPRSEPGEEFTFTLELECAEINLAVEEVSDVLESEATKKLKPEPLVELQEAKKRCDELLALAHTERVERVAEEGFSYDNVRASRGVFESARDFSRLSKAYFGVIEVQKEVIEIVTLQREEGLIDEDEYKTVLAKADRCQQIAWKAMFGTFQNEDRSIGDARTCIDSVKAERIARSQELTEISFGFGSLWYLFILLALLPVGVGYLWWRRSSDNRVELDP